MSTNLTAYLRRYIALTDEEARLFASFLTPQNLAKKEYLLKEGSICHARYYILEGCVRMYYIDQKANEQVVHFGIDNWWITDYESLIGRTPSKLFIQATEDTSLLVLSRSNFEKLCTALPQAERLFRIIMEKTYIAAQRRLEYMFSLSGETLYRRFIANNPAFVQRVPQYMIASYLGMTPEFISKIRNSE